MGQPIKLESSTGYYVHDYLTLSREGLLDPSTGFSSAAPRGMSRGYFNLVTSSLNNLFSGIKLSISSFCFLWSKMISSRSNVFM